jgi:ketosteroid isomerase-like protein
VPAPTRELAEALYEAFSARDLEAVLALISGDFEFRPAVTSELTERQSYDGHDGMRDYFADVARVWTELRLIPQRFRPIGERLLVLGRVYARTTDGALIDSPAGWLWEARAGKLTRCVVYRSHTEAIAAAGLSESEAYADPH